MRGAGKDNASNPRILYPVSCILLLDSAGYAADTSRIDFAARVVLFSSACG
jgi:hypothetical protein